MTGADVAGDEDPDAGPDAGPVRGLSLTRTRILVVLVAALTSVPMLQLHDLWHSDEPRYAQVAREIVRDGDWIVMHLNQERYTEKPPLYFWCEALLGKLFGDVGPFAARFPSALAGAIGVLLCFELGRRLFRDQDGARIGLAGALFLATSEQWCWISQRCALDVMLAAFVLGALLLDETGWRVAAFAAVGAGFLVKGPPVLIFFLLAHVARAWGERDWRRLARVPWLRGLLAFAAVVALWAVPWVHALGLDAVKHILFRQTAGRMSESFAHKQPWHFYLRTVPVTFLPWSLAWLLLAWLAWKQRGTRRPLPAASRFLLAWAAACFVVFSCISGKRTLYLVPIFPALALLTAAALERLAPAGRDLLGGARRLAAGAALFFCAAGFVWLPLADRGFAFGPIALPAASPRNLGERVRRELDAGRTVVLLNLPHDESVLYYSGAHHLEGLDLPARPDAAPDHPAVVRLRELAAGLGDRLVLVAKAEDGARYAALLPKGGDPIDELVSDDRAYALWRGRP